MKRWPWPKILAGIACLLIGMGIFPIVSLIWYAKSHNFTPVNMPLPLKQGTYTSPLFKPDLDSYQIDLQWDSSVKSIPVDLDWKIVDEKAHVLQVGSYKSQAVGNEVGLGDYRSKPASLFALQRRLRLKLIVNVHQDAAGVDVEVPRLKVENPEFSLDASYAAVPFLIWAALVGGGGGILLIVLYARRRVGRNEYK